MNNIRFLFDTKYPVIQGGMANIATAQLAVAVSNAGGLGLIGAGGNDAKWVKSEISKLRKLTNKPFGVNVMLMSPHAKEIAQLVIDEKVSVVTTGAGTPKPYIKAWKDAGITVIPVVATVRHAVKMEELGADAIVVEGTEAGGHVGEATLMSILPQVVDSVSIPVIAAGGIADSRGVLAAFALGAKGVQIGTVLLATDECPIHSNYKQLIVDSNDSATTVTGRSIGAPVRVIKNDMTNKYIELEKMCDVPRDEFEKLTLGSLGKAVIEGDVNSGSFMAGQIIGLIKEVRPVKEVLENMFEPIYQNVENLLKDFKTK